MSTNMCLKFSVTTLRITTLSILSLYITPLSLMTQHNKKIYKLSMMRVSIIMTFDANAERHALLQLNPLCSVL